MTSCSYSVQSGLSTNCAGGYSVTIDTVVASAGVMNSDSSASNRTSSDKHKLFTTKIGLSFSTGTWNGYSATGSGSMKYILGNWFYMTSLLNVVIAYSLTVDIIHTVAIQ